MKKIISMISIIMMIISSISTVFATNIDVNSIIEDTVNEIVDNTTDDEIDNKKMTKEELENAIKKINDSENITGKIILEDDKIILKTDEDIEYSMTYDLEANPKFTSKTIFTKDMNLEQFEEKTGELINGVFGFIIIAVHKGIEMEDALFYAVLSTLSVSTELEKIHKNDEFDAIQVATDIFENEIFKENELFNVRMKKVSSSESEYIVESTYEVKIDEDFSKLEGATAGLEESFQNTINAMQEFNQATINEQIAMNEALEWLEEENIIEIPQTGKTLDTEDILWIILISSVGVFGLYCIYNKRKNGKE